MHLYSHSHTKVKFIVFHQAVTVTEKMKARKRRRNMGAGGSHGGGRIILLNRVDRQYLTEKVIFE